MSNSWVEKRPSRLQVAYTYSKRILRWRSNNAPYISGDLFADNADVNVFPPKYRGKQPSNKEIASARVIFCPSDKLNQFFDEYRNVITAKVIIAGNSDFEFHDLPIRIPTSIRHLSCRTLTFQIINMLQLCLSESKTFGGALMATLEI